MDTKPKGIYDLLFLQIKRMNITSRRRDEKNDRSKSTQFTRRT